VGEPSCDIPPGDGSPAIATHSQPAWRHKADFLLHADLADWNMPGRREQLWARRVDECLFELCCIPFFPYGMRLGDVVETSPRAGIEFMVYRVVKHAGRINLRLAVADRVECNPLMPLIESMLADTGCQYEVFKPGYVACDIPTSSAEQYLRILVRDLVNQGRVFIESI
jgi:hypothetical protein